MSTFFRKISNVIYDINRRCYLSLNIPRRKINVHLPVKNKWHSILIYDIVNFNHYLSSFSSALVGVGVTFHSWKCTEGEGQTFLREDSHTEELR